MSYVNQELVLLKGLGYDTHACALMSHKVCHTLERDIQTSATLELMDEHSLDVYHS